MGWPRHGFHHGGPIVFGTSDEQPGCAVAGQRKGNALGQRDQALGFLVVPGAEKRETSLHPHGHFHECRHLSLLLVLGENHLPGPRWFRPGVDTAQRVDGQYVLAGRDDRVDGRGSDLRALDPLLGGPDHETQEPEDHDHHHRNDRAAVDDPGGCRDRVVQHEQEQVDRDAPQQPVAPDAQSQPEDDPHSQDQECRVDQREGAATKEFREEQDGPGNGLGEQQVDRSGLEHPGHDWCRDHDRDQCPDHRDEQEDEDLQQPVDSLFQFVLAEGDVLEQDEADVGHVDHFAGTGVDVFGQGGFQHQSIESQLPVFFERGFLAGQSFRLLGKRFDGHPGLGRERRLTDLFGQLAAKTAVQFGHGSAVGSVRAKRFQLVLQFVGKATADPAGRAVCLGLPHPDGQRLHVDNVAAVNSGSHCWFDGEPGQQHQEAGDHDQSLIHI